MRHFREQPATDASLEAERQGNARLARRGFLAGVAVAALYLLPWVREATAQVCYDQYGRPVTVPPGTAVAPVAPPPTAYVPAGAVSGTRQVARRTARRTGRRGELREEAWDAID